MKRTPCLTLDLNLAALFLALAATGLATSGQVLAGGPGAGDLLVAPTRVVFEGRQRTAELTLVNVGDAPATYRISFVHQRMDESGGTHQITDQENGGRYVDDLVRYSPRQVTLLPRVAQTVRMQLRLPAELEAGEYRSHLLFRAVPANNPAAGDAATAAAPEGMSIQLTPIYGVSIPVIVRHGETSAKVTISDLELRQPSGADLFPTLKVVMSRTGNQSVFGNLTVAFVPVSGSPTVVGVVNGVAVYTPNAARRIAIPIRPPAGVVITSGTLKVTYSLQETHDGVLAQAEVRLP
jgi:P pilus assembly chaperone PapD